MLNKENPKDVIHLKTFVGCLSTAVLYLHNNDTIHGDLKCKNILVKNGEVLLCDFGISRKLMDTEESTHFLGTPRYCAPEVEGEEERKHPSDIFSLGCVFLEMVTVIRGFTLAALNEHLKGSVEEKNNDKIVFHKASSQVVSWLNELETAGPDPGLIPLIRNMHL
ncbi:hypothetical protein W97_04960 [Coniosporium apollinis CBS 100218]|uniref:Protein kinase domain-containing protein n=1 Tax=Coniosporium apollinis (strain CBS 100218) TaxID=1168221 RepID=R7YVP0_CONA1|nr:uncharacterized protein W97_04960 [Coniosporium apollinis CBS 100218]EON65721.1 hypothetical protein W97_04960 [Coniosporium apollinis CBS 100218]